MSSTDQSNTGNSVTVVKSLCMHCGSTGETRLLYTTIPFFREIILSSFECKKCHFKSTEVQPAGIIQTHGVKFTLKVATKEDLNREIVKSENATFRILELEFEIPAKIGKLSTVEGLIDNAIEELQFYYEKNKSFVMDSKSENEEKRKEQLEDLNKVMKFIEKLRSINEGDEDMFPFTVELDDPTGNSFVQNPFAPKHDPKLRQLNYFRTKKQNEEIGLDYQSQTNLDYKSGANITTGPEKADATANEVEKESLHLPANCPSCNSEGFSQMCLTEIPFFKQIIIFAFNCDACGFRNNEVKPGGAISNFGKKIYLTVTKRTFEEDMKRDVVKSTSCGILIPEIDLEVVHGSLGGIYTTIEGLLDTISDKLFQSDFAAEFVRGDSADTAQKTAFETFETMFKKLTSNEMEQFTIILDDPLDCSFIYSEIGPEHDPQIKVETYERSFDQNEEFGLNDMKVENYDDIQDLHKVEATSPQNDHSITLEKMKQLQPKGMETHPQKHIINPPEGTLE